MFIYVITKFFWELIIAPVLLMFSTSGYQPTKMQKCGCDSLEADRIIRTKSFNRSALYDIVNFTADSFYNADDHINRLLWYRDIESPVTTKFTALWDAYRPYNYHASHKDFVKYYSEKKNIELAFQFGPNTDLWAYHIFVVRKIKCCFLITRSYFRHARFTYKAYAIVESSQLDQLYSLLDTIHIKPILPVNSYGYKGFFMDNRNNRKFYIDFDKEMEKENNQLRYKNEIKNLFQFVDEKIKWKITYVM